MKVSYVLFAWAYDRVVTVESTESFPAAA